MKLIHSAICAILLGIVLIIATPVFSRSSQLLGAKECTWGPSYWCSNITNAKNCKAVSHCIQTVWEKQTVPEDNDSICQICLDMVKQARDQLESNVTQNDLREVFEGSCRLIPLKPIQKQCIKLADDFIPELVEALASQMNPQIVCSVAGLCNNVAIDVMLEEHAKNQITDKTPLKEIAFSREHLSCSGCNNVASLIAKKFHAANRDDILDNLLHLCGRMSSFSDACGNIILTYFNDIYTQLKEKLDGAGICHISGVCSALYHQHPEDSIEIRPMSDVGVVPVKGDDIPCELCEQLVRHLRDLLVANTTEAEFKQVLDGLCNQTKGFKAECTSIVDQYYDVIYETLVNKLDENGACFLIGVCPKGSESDMIKNLPVFPPVKIQVSIKELPKKKTLGDDEMQLTNDQINAMQLPIDKLLGAPINTQLVENGQLCTLCEYFLHFVQESLATPSTEAEIKKAVSSACNELPASIGGECRNFVDMYGDAVIALLIQGIDARVVCPEMKMCPSTHDIEVFAPQPIEVTINSNSDETDKPTCPLCLLAVQEAQEMIKSDKSTSHIKQVLDGLCVHLPKKLKDECVDFIETYSSELIKMLVNDFTSQQICVQIRLCTDNMPSLSEWNIEVEKKPDTLTNEIPDNTINGQPIESYNMEHVSSPQCLLCERMIKEAEKQIVNKKSREQIKHALEHACDKINKLKAKCEQYIEKYGDKIVDLIMQELTPKQICRELGYCIWSRTEDLDIDEAIKIDVIAFPADYSTNGFTGLDDIVNKGTVAETPGCVLCEFVISKLEQDLKDKKTEKEIKDAIENVCKKMPNTVAAKCNKFVDEYADMIINLVDTVPPKEICKNLQLCVAMSDVLNDEVIECGICHGATLSLLPFLKTQLQQQVDPQEMIEKACESLPSKYYEQCSEMIEYYGESIFNLIKYNTDESQICAEIGKCFKNEEPNKSYVHIIRESKESNRKNLVGANECTFGPSHWCSKREVAAKCNMIEYCEERVWNKVEESTV